MRFFRLTTFALAIGLTTALPTETKPRDLEVRSDVSLHPLFPLQTNSNQVLPRQAPTLVGATISFHTNDEDKDGNSHVTVTVKDGSKIICARTDSDFGRFGDNNDNGPFGLDIFNPSTRAAVQAGTVTIRLDPHGNDTWRFNWVIIFSYSDGSKGATSGDGVQLSQDKREQTWGVTPP